MVFNVLFYFSSFFIGVVLGGMALFLSRRLMLAHQMRVAERKANRMVSEASAEAKPRPVSIDNIPVDQRIVDIGARTVSRFSQELGRCRTVFWNGPMGIHEIPRFAGGTQAMARLLAGLTATTVIGGGSTAEVVAHLGLADKMGFVSTGGGASLRFLSGESLPGVEVLRDKEAIANG